MPNTNGGDNKVPPTFKYKVGLSVRLAHSSKPYTIVQRILIAGDLDQEDNAVPGYRLVYDNIISGKPEVVSIPEEALFG